MKKIKLIPLKEKKEQEFIDTYQCFKHINEIPKSCEHCSNHPSNGGSGICFCTAPYHSYDITYNTYDFQRRETYE